MQIAIFGRYFKEERYNELQQFFDYLEEKKIAIPKNSL